MHGVQNHYYFASQPTQLAGHPQVAGGFLPQPAAAPQASDAGTPTLLWVGWLAFLAALLLPIALHGERSVSGWIYAYMTLSVAARDIVHAYDQALVYGLGRVHLNWQVVAHAIGILLVAAAPLLWQARASRRSIGLLMVPLTFLVLCAGAAIDGIIPSLANHLRFAGFDGAGYYAVVGSWMAVTTCFLRGR